MENKEKEKTKKDILPKSTAFEESILLHWQYQVRVNGSCNAKQQKRGRDFHKSSNNYLANVGKQVLSHMDYKNSLNIRNLEMQECPSQSRLHSVSNASSNTPDNLSGKSINNSVITFGFQGLI